MTLQVSDVLDGTASCFLTLQGLQLFPALRGEVDFSARGPVLFTPTHPAVITDHENRILRQMSLLNGTHFDQLVTGIPTRHIEADVNTLFHVHASAQAHVKEGYWMAVSLIAVGVIMAIFLGYYFTQSYVQTLIKRCIYKSDSGESTQKPREVNPSTSQPNPTDPEGKNLDEGPAQVQYSKYPLPTA